MEKKFNKLVRDNIPSIIESNDEEAETRILNDDEYNRELNNKLYEEVKEVIQAKDKDSITEELADLLEVILAKGKLYGISFEDIERIRKDKLKTKGGFDSRIYLIKTMDKSYCDNCNSKNCSRPESELSDYELNGRIPGKYCVDFEAKEWVKK